MGGFIREISKEWKIFTDITRFKWVDLIVFFFGAPGGLHILSSLPFPIEDIVSGRVASIILTYQSFMHEKIWGPVSDFLNLFEINVPMAYFDLISGIFALMIMMFSSLLSGRRESITDMATRIVHYEDNEEFDYDDGRAYFNIFTYPFVVPYIFIFSLPLASVIDPDLSKGYQWLIAIPILLVSSFVFGGLRGIAKKAPKNKDGSVKPVSVRPYIYLSLIVGGFVATLIVVGMAILAVSVSVWISVISAVFLVWLMLLFLLLTYHVNWRSLPIMMLWALVFSII